MWLVNRVRSVYGWLIIYVISQSIAIAMSGPSIYNICKTSFE